MIIGRLFIFLCAVLVISMVMIFITLVVIGFIWIFGDVLKQILNNIFPQLITRINRTFPVKFNLETVGALVLIIIMLVVTLSLSILGSLVLFPTAKIGTDPFLIAPLMAITMISIVGAVFIQNMYEIRFRDAIYYIFVSMYRIFQPRVIIDNGRIFIQQFGRNTEVMPSHSNRQPSAAAHDVINELYVTLVRIGGPGMMIVQPGNACVTNNLRGPANVGITRSVELRRFERIGFVAELDDQHDKAQEVRAITRDGVRVVCPEVNYRYRIIFKKKEDNPKEDEPRTLDNPFPFDPDALIRMTYNLQVDETGNRRDLHMQVRILVSTAVREFINAHTVDYLTAPREGSRNIRNEIRTSIIKKTRLWNMGVQLIMVDMGHIQVAEVVHESRLASWAADWIGDAEIERAYADGTQHGLEELGRAQAQAEMILSIVSSLKTVIRPEDKLENVRNIFLTRVSMILDAMRTNQKAHQTTDLVTTPRRNQ